MSRPEMGHLEDEQLLRYADGESPAAAAVEIRRHLEACWQCREQLAALQNTIGERVRYRKRILQRHLPEPPAPWSDIYRGFAEIDATLQPGSFGERVARVLWIPVRALKIAAPVAVALAVACLLFYRFRQAPSVQAAELLRKAVAAGDAHPGKSRLLQLRTKNLRLIRAAGPDATATGEIRALFQEAGYDWDNPLSAKAYQTWRDRLADKSDQVTEESGAYRIRTSTASGHLMVATLKIRAQDLTPIEERFEFRNREWVEISEAPENSSAPNLIASSAPTIIHHGDAGVRSPSSPATIGDELHVLSALHQAGADLGDPIEVSRSGGEILVAGIGIAPLRQQEIQNALRSQKRVVVHFSEPASAQIEPQKEPATEPAGGADFNRLQARLAEQIGGRVIFSQLASQILDMSEPMMARAYALRRLAARIPITAEAELSAPDRQLLSSLLREHTAALLRQTAELDRLLTPVLEGPAPAPDGRNFLERWQPAAEELFQSVRQVDKLLAVMFGAATGESSGEQLPFQLRSSLAQLRTRLATCDRVSTSTPERR
jgi:hypothetical protein